MLVVCRTVGIKDLSESLNSFRLQLLCQVRVEELPCQCRLRPSGRPWSIQRPLRASWLACSAKKLHDATLRISLSALKEHDRSAVHYPAHLSRPPSRGLGAEAVQMLRLTSSCSALTTCRRLYARKPVKTFRETILLGVQMPPVHARMTKLTVPT